MTLLSASVQRSELFLTDKTSHLIFSTPQKKDSTYDGHCFRNENHINPNSKYFGEIIPLHPYPLPQFWTYLLQSWHAFILNSSFSSFLLKLSSSSPNHYNTFFPHLLSSKINELFQVLPQNAEKYHLTHTEICSYWNACSFVELNTVWKRKNNYSSLSCLFAKIRTQFTVEMDRFSVHETARKS